MEAGEATRPPDEAETPPHTPPGCRGAVTPLLVRRARDLFNRGAMRHATAGFPSTRGNLNIEEHKPPPNTSPPLTPPGFGQTPHLHNSSHLEEVLTSAEEKIKNNPTSWTSARSGRSACFLASPPAQTEGGRGRCERERTAWRSGSGGEVR